MGRNNDARRMPRPNLAAGPQADRTSVRAIVVTLSRMPFSSLLSRELSELRRACNVDSHQRGDPSPPETTLVALGVYLERLAVVLDQVAADQQLEREELANYRGLTNHAAWWLEQVDRVGKDDPAHGP